MEASASGVRTVDARNIKSHDEFLAVLDGRDEPLLLRNAPTMPGTVDFTCESLGSEFGHIQFPSPSAKSGKGKDCCILSIADQGDSKVMGAQPKACNFSGRTLLDFLESIKKGSGYYLSTRSPKGACKRVGQMLTYIEPAREFEDFNNVIIKELVPRAPAPLLLPMDTGFQMVFWLGQQGNNFGLHTDLFSEQFLMQHQGTKEIYLLLPEDASLVEPFSFLRSPLFYKSEGRSVTNLNLPKGCLLRTLLQPGDLLYIPPWWWHEVCTVSAGPSLSSTFRFHTKDDESFNLAMRTFYQFHSNSEKRSKRLSQHICSFFSYALKDGISARADKSMLSSRDMKLLVGTVVAVTASALLGFIIGRRSATYHK